MNVVKRRVNYRKGTKDKNCSTCAEWVPKWQVKRIGGVDHKQAPRCAVIGFESSIHYQIHCDYVCDKHRWRSAEDVELAKLICNHTWEPPCDDCILKIAEIKKIMCSNCGLQRSVDEALNSGDGVYRP